MTRHLPLIAVAGPFALLSAALISQFVGGLNPCPMCIWQRWPHAAAILIGALALILGRGRGGPLFYGVALAVAVSAAIGVLHAGVEQGWWDSPIGCSGASLEGLTPQEAMQQLLNAPLVKCDEIVWSFLGLSMAAWNAVISAGLTVVALMAARRSA